MTDTQSQAAKAFADLNDPKDAATAHVKEAVSAVYDGVASWSTKGDFWNWGLHDEETLGRITSLIPGFARFDTDGFSEQLYFQALHDVPIPLDGYATRSVLEVGCGMGEGLNFLSRLVQAPAMVGLDLSTAAVERANALLSRGSALRFVQGDAEELPFEDDQFDVVINVESSHNYPDFGKFVREVTRVLKPGGYFSLVDLFTKRSYEQLSQIKQDPSELTWISERDITEQVKKSIRQRLLPDNYYRKNYASKKIPLRARILGGQGGAHYCGADFIGHQDPLDRVLEFVGVRPKRIQMDYDSYRLHVARKSG